MSLSTIQEIQTYLNEVPIETCQRFATLLIKAQSINDIEQVKRLVSVAQPILEGNRYLQQWHTYAHGYLAIADQNQPNKAISLLKSLQFQAQTEGLYLDLLGRVLNGLGIAYEIKEQWDQAMRFYQDAIVFYEANSDDLGLGKTLYNLAIIHYKGQSYTESIACINRAIALLDQHLDDVVWQTNLGNAWNELGLVQIRLGKFIEARDAILHSLAIDKHWDNLEGQIVSYINLGDVHRKLHETEAATDFYNQAYDLATKNEFNFNIAEAVHGLGLLKFQAQLFGDAQKLFNKALTLAQSVNNYDIITDIYLRRADLQELLGQPDQALIETRQAVDNVETLRANIVTPETRILLQGAWIEAYEKMVERLYRVGNYAEAFQYVEMAKSRAFIEMLAGRPIRRPENVPSEWVTQESNLREQLKNLYETPDVDHDQITNLEAELGQLRQNIRLRDAEFESFQTVAPLSLDALMARLPANAVLIEYFTVGNSILTFVVTKDKVQAVKLPEPITNLERIFDKNNGQVKHLTRGHQRKLKLQENQWLLEHLYKALIEPLGEMVWVTPLLCIVPHKSLHYIPFHALYRTMNKQRQYLAGEGENLKQIIYAPSATTLFEHCQNKDSSNQSSCLAIGYNNIHQQLTQAELEASKIAQLTKGDSYIGQEATKALIFEQGANYQYLHFSCHAHFNPTWPTSSSLSLADGNLDVTDIIRDLRLQADLVTLSACETGRSHVTQGDELVGLTRAFLYAGTPSVLVSHWMVDDLPTRLLMELFYQELQATTHITGIAKKAQALSKAQAFIRNLPYTKLREILYDNQIEVENVKLEEQLEILAQSAGYTSQQDVPDETCLLSHPYYWASFFLVGDRLKV